MLMEHSDVIEEAFPQILETRKISYRMNIKLGRKERYLYYSGKAKKTFS